MRHGCPFPRFFATHETSWGWGRPAIKAACLDVAQAQGGSKLFRNGEAEVLHSLRMALQMVCKSHGAVRQPTSPSAIFLPTIENAFKNRFFQWLGGESGIWIPDPPPTPGPKPACTGVCPGILAFRLYLSSRKIRAHVLGKSSSQLTVRQTRDTWQASRLQPQPGDVDDRLSRQGVPCPAMSRRRRHRAPQVSLAMTRAPPS
jgi:hypothetical protein